MDTITCKHCENKFALKAKYHAGLSDLGFLYCDSDTTVLTFNAYDPRFEEASGCPSCVPWQLTEEQKKRVEESLLSCPLGGEFSFKNPLRCPNCGKPLAEPMTKDIYMYVLDRVVDGEKERIWKEEGK